MRSPEAEPQAPSVQETGNVGIPEDLKKETGVEEVKETYPETVVDDKGRNLIETPETKETVIKIPKTIEAYKKEEKGSIFDTITWNAKMILRKIAKAIFRGKRVEVEGKS